MDLSTNQGLKMLTKTQITALRIKLDACLKEFAEQNNLVSGVGTITYTEKDFTAKVIFSDKDSNPNAVNPQFLTDLAKRGWQHGLTADMVGKEIVMPSRASLSKFQFQGMKNSKVVLKDVQDGKSYLFNAEAAAHYLKK